MTNLNVSGLDLAKHIFHVVHLDERGKMTGKKKLTRTKLLEHFACRERRLIAMEACASAHYWARELIALGHEVKMIPPLYVKPYVRGNKNDYNDALGIAEAASNPQMRTVKVKTVDEQAIQSLHRLRRQALKMRTGLCNQLRGLLAEYGVIAPRGVHTLRRRLPEILEEADNGLCDLFRESLSEGYAQLLELDHHIDRYTEKVNRHSASHEACCRLQSIPGFGPIASSVFLSVVGDGSGFRRGRDVSASIGLVPRQHSSGGKDRLLGISKRGNGYLRSVLVHGARSVVSRIGEKQDALSRWIRRIKSTRGFNKAVVALANKMARMGWAILVTNGVYEPKRHITA